MKKVKALITLVVGKGAEVPPEAVCEVSDDEAKRLIALGVCQSGIRTGKQSYEHKQTTTKKQGN